MKAISNLILMLLALSAAAAAQEPHLDVRTTVEKEQLRIDENGERVVQLVPASTVVPGERVVYTITFRNVSTEAADNVVITNPIAGTLTYVDGSATGPDANIQFSVDGGQSFDARDSLTVREQGAERPAEAKDFTHIRWVMKEELAAGAEGFAQFAAVLD